MYGRKFNGGNSIDVVCRRAPLSEHKRFILPCFGDVKRNSPIYSRRGEMIPLVEEPHVHIIQMDGINKFIYKDGHIQTLM